MNSKPSRVLLVDDDPATRLGLEELLTGAGYMTVAVASFEEALRALRDDTPDLLIADVRLGAFNGLQLLVSTHRPVPAIVITGFADPVLEADARQHGADYVLKPISPPSLLEMVRRKLAQVEQSQFDTLRRWERKPVREDLAVRVDDQPARIVDISYGGLRFELPRGGGDEGPPPSLSVRLAAADLSVRADVVWHRLSGESAWLCGAAVSQTSPAVAREWRGIVDAIA